MFSNRPATAGSTECERSGCELVIKILPAFNLAARYVTSMGTFIGFFSATRGFYCLCPDKSCPRQRYDKHLPRAEDALGSLWAVTVSMQRTLPKTRPMYSQAAAAAATRMESHLTAAVVGFFLLLSYWQQQQQEYICRAFSSFSSPLFPMHLLFLQPQQPFSSGSNLFCLQCWGAGRTILSPMFWFYRCTKDD